MAGVFEVPFPQFLLFTTLSALIWSGFWLGSGFFFGKKLVPLVRHFDKSGYIVLAVVILLITWLLVRRQQRRARQRVGSKVEQSGGG